MQVLHNNLQTCMEKEPMNDMWENFPVLSQSMHDTYTCSNFTHASHTSYIFYMSKQETMCLCIAFCLHQQRHFIFFLKQKVLHVSWWQNPLFISFSLTCLAVYRKNRKSFRIFSLLLDCHLLVLHNNVLNVKRKYVKRREQLYCSYNKGTGYYVDND